MKKVLALLFALVIATSLFACAATGSGGTSATPGSASSAAPPSASGTASDLKFPKEAGYFDASFDYSKFDKFKVGHVAMQAGELWDAFDNAYALWAKRVNFNYTKMWTPTNYSDDEYLSGLQTFIDQGYDGLIVEPNQTICSRVAEILDENKIPWVSGLGESIDSNGRLLHPHVGFNNYQIGLDIDNNLVAWKNQTWPDVPWDKVGLIVLDFSLNAEIHQRYVSMKQQWVNLHPEFGAFDAAVDKNPKNFFYGDIATAGMDQTAAQNLTTQFLSNPGDIEVWLIGTPADLYSVGAANAADALHMTDKVDTVCNGGVALPGRWDSGIDDAWRAADFAAQTLYAEPIICQLWAYLTGQSTPETIWPEWVNINHKGDEIDAAGKVVKEHNFAELQLPCYFIDKTNYKTYLAWTDLYAFGPGVKGMWPDYPPVTDINMFPSRTSVPDYYKTKTTAAPSPSPSAKPSPSPSAPLIKVEGADWKTSPITFKTSDLGDVSGTMNWNPKTLEWLITYKTQYGSPTLAGTYTDDGTLTMTQDSSGGYAKSVVPSIQTAFQELLKG